MQVTFKAVSSMVNESTVMIEVHTTIGDHTTTQRSGYDTIDLMDNRFLAGLLEQRIETLRVAAQNTAEASFRAQYAALLAYQVPAAPVPTSVPEVDQAAIDQQTLAAEQHVEQASQEPVKKARKPRTTKPTNESAE